MKRLLLCTLCFVLLGAQDCTPPPEPDVPPSGGTDYCKGNEYTIWDRLGDYGSSAYDVAYDTIIGGIPSTDRRSTVQVLFGQAYCTGVVINQHTVLTAAHCGYAATTTHRAVIEGVGTFNSTEHLYHPDYQGWIDRNHAGGGAESFALEGANYDTATGIEVRDDSRSVASIVAAEGVPPLETSLEARKSDLMLLYFEDTLPAPYIGLAFYLSPIYADRCDGLVIHGYGRWEQPGAMLREAKYLITSENGKYVHSVMTPEGKICFGDSGGPLYADVDGVRYLAGITTTTMSADCLAGGTHVSLGHLPYVNWVADNKRNVEPG